MSNQQLAPVEIPDKPTFKPSEVCDLLGIPAYVLRTWENEFKDLGADRSAGGARNYRRSDVELAVRIRELVFREHLTLAGVRRRLEREQLLTPPAEHAAAAPQAAMGETLAEPARARLTQVKEELRLLLQRLAHDARQEVVDERQPGGGNAAGPAELPANDDPIGASRRGAPRAARQATDAPPLPGFEATAAPPVRGDPRSAEEPRMDPSALNFASVAAAPIPPGGRRRRNRGEA
jgi:DNA-binding transcriptional MerR regulator